MLARKLFIFFLAFSVIFQTPAFAQGKGTLPSLSQANLTTVDDVQKAYPHARVQTVTVAELEAIKRQLVAQTNQDGQPVTPVEPPPPLPPEPPKKISSSTEEWNECRYYESLFYYHEATEDAEGIPLDRRGAKEPKFNFDSDFSFKGDKDFLIIVAVIGIVIVAALVVYAGAYLYQSFANKLACKSWDELGFRYTNIFDDNDTQVRDGELKGLYYSRGYYFPSGVMGLTAEVGQFKLDLKVNGTGDTRNYSGPYFLVGPTFTFPITALDRQYFAIELLGGTTTESKIGLMSTLRFSLGFNFGPNVGLSIGTGAAFIKVKEFDSYLASHDDLNFMTGFKTTVRF